MPDEDSHGVRALPAPAVATPKVLRKCKDATETSGDSCAAKLPALMPALPTLAIDMGDCDTDDKANDYLFGKPKDTNSLLPTRAIMKMNRRYEGDRIKSGTITLIVCKQTRALLSMALNATPAVAGKAVIKYLEDKKGAKMQTRHPGIKWVGIDEAGVTKDDQLLKKLGWFANIGTTDGAENLQDPIKNAATEIIEANLPVDFQLAEVQLDDDAKRKHAEKMNALIGHFGGF